MKNAFFVTLPLQVKEERAKSVFRFVQPHLKINGLPVKDLNNICCWENYQYSLLCLDDNVFDEIFELLLNKQDKEENKIQNFKKEFKSNLANSEDNILKELELAASKGNMDDIDALLNIFDKL